MRSRREARFSASSFPSPPFPRAGGGWIGVVCYGFSSSSLPSTFSLPHASAHARTRARAHARTPSLRLFRGGGGRLPALLPTPAMRQPPGFAAETAIPSSHSSPRRRLPIRGMCSVLLRQARADGASQARPWRGPTGRAPVYRTCRPEPPQGGRRMIGRPGARLFTGLAGAAGAVHLDGSVALQAPPGVGGLRTRARAVRATAALNIHKYRC